MTTNIPPFALYSTTRGVAVIRTGQVARGRVEIHFLHRIATCEVGPVGYGRIERPYLSHATPRMTPLPPSVMTRLEAGFTAMIPDAWIHDPTTAIDIEPEEDDESETETEIEYDEIEYDESEIEGQWEAFFPPEYEEAVRGLPRYEDVPPPSYSDAIMIPPMYEPTRRHMRAHLAAAAAERRMVSA